MALILHLNNQNAEFYYNLALEQLESGIHYEAILNLIKANELSNNSTYKLQLAEAYYNTQNFLQSTNIYIKLFFDKRRLAYILAIYRNLLLMGRTLDARKFILSCFRDFDSILTDTYEDLPQMDENELQKVMGLAENDDVNGFLNLVDAYNEATLIHLKNLIAKSDFDTAIMNAMEVPPESKLYDSAQEIICIAAHARGDFELVEETARALSARVPDNVIAFGVLAVMTSRVTREEIEMRASALTALIKNRADKALDFLKTLAHSHYNGLFETYLEEIYNANSCVFGIIAYKMFAMLAQGKSAEGNACLKRLQMLFPNDYKVRAYTGLVDAKSPLQCWEELKFAPYCTDIIAVEERFFDIEPKFKSKKKAAEDIQNMLSVMLLCCVEDDCSNIVNLAFGAHNSLNGTLKAYFEQLLSDINISAENKCDLIYGMLMYGWDAVADVMMGDTFVRCRISSLNIDKLPVKIARLYSEAYVQMISDGEEPRAEALLDVIERMRAIGIKNGMKQEALLAVLHYVYEMEIGSEEELFEDYIEIYDANPPTAHKYYQIFKSIIE